MATSFDCEIVTPEQRLYSGEVVYTSAPAAEGEIGFMHQCSPLMSTLKRGTIAIREHDGDDMIKFAVDNGYVEADGYKVVVLAGHAMNIADVDVEVSNQQIEKNKERLAELPEGDSRAIFCKDEITWQEYLIECAAKA
jgi:F-type H+-transporting ATPase subunit epsilon